MINHESVGRMDFQDLLDRMAEYALSGKEVELYDAVQDFHRTGFSCAVFPEPQDGDRTTLAMKAALIERMAQVFAMPPHNRTYEIPEWCQKDWTCPRTIRLQSQDILALDEPNEIFQKRNIRTLKNFLYFV